MKNQIDVIEPPPGVKLHSYLKKVVTGPLRTAQAQSNLVKNGVERVWPSLGISITLKEVAGKLHLSVDQKKQDRNGKTITQNVFTLSSGSLQDISNSLSTLFKSYQSN